MSRPLTAALSKMALEERLELYFRLRASSLDTRFAHDIRSMYRVAARTVWSSIDHPMYDMMYRLQVLEGAYSGSATNLKWWRNPPRGMAAAQDAFSGKNVHPDWFSTGKTGLLGVLNALVKREYQSWARQYAGMRNTWEDIMQNAIAGIGISLDDEGLPKPMPGGPIAGQVGAKNSGVQKDILSGKPPKAVAGNIAKQVAKKIGDEVTSMDKQRGHNVTPEGDDLLERSDTSLTRSTRDFYEVLADLIGEPRSPVAKMFKQALERILGGQGKWAELAFEILTGQLTGSGDFSYGWKQRWAERYEMAPGTFSKVLRTQVEPAIKKVKEDKALLGSIRAEVDAYMRGRMASTKQANSTGMVFLASRVDPRKLAQVKKALSGDVQSSKLLREVQRELLTRLAVDDSTDRALNRLSNLTTGSMDPSNLRNQVFKVADELGIRLPSAGLF